MVKRIFILISIICIALIPSISLAKDVVVKIDSAKAQAADKNIEIPIVVSDVSGLGIIAADIVLEYNESLLSLVSISKEGTLTESWSGPIYKAMPGRINISIYHTDVLVGKGKLLKIYFDVKPEAKKGKSVIKLKKFKFNGGRVPVQLKTGQLKVIKKR